MGRDGVLERENRSCSISELIERGGYPVWRPFTQAGTATAPVPIVRGRGSILYGEKGEEIIDAISSWWVTLHGHCHPYIVGKVKAQLENLEHVMFADYTHQPGVELAQKLVGILKGFSRIFYTDNGSTAVETALKIGFQYWHNQDPNTKKKRVIAFRGGYHGDTIGAMSVSDRSFFSSPFQHVLFDIDFIDPPKEDHEEVVIEEFRRLIRSGEHALFIFEPILQGVAGMKRHSSEGLDRLIGLAREYGVLTIADEVMTGFGRTGPRFAIDRLRNRPDMICLSKGLSGGFLPLGVTVVSEEIYEKFVSMDRGKALLHGHSFCGNPIACSAGIGSIDLLVTEECDLQRNRIEASHRRFVDEWGGAEKIRHADVIGTVLSLEYATEESNGYFNSARDRLCAHFRERNILMRPFGNSIHLVPPYCITEDELKKVYEAIVDTLKEE